MPHVILIWFLPSVYPGAHMTLLRGVQFFHRRVNIACNDIRQHVHSCVYRLLNRRPVIAGRYLQHIANHIITMSRMANTNTQPQKILATKMRNQVTQPVMTTVTTTLLEFHGTDRQIQLIMYHKNATARYPVKTGQRSHRHAAAVHEIHGLLQTKVIARQSAASNLAFVLALGTELRVALTSDCIDEPEPGIMPGLFIFSSGITQPGNEPYGSQ